MDLSGSPGPLERSKRTTDDGEVKQRIQVFLGEFRILVPALGALFGFQLTSAFSNGWDKLTSLDKLVNLGSTSCTALAIGFLLLPANYHRVTAQVPEDEEFLHFAQRSFGWAFLFVGLGIVGSLYLQSRRVTDDRMVALAFTLAFALFFLIMWAILPRARARKLDEDHGQTHPERRSHSSGGQ